MRKICVIGAGYVGLTTGTCFADLGHQVTCVDVDGPRIDRLRAGEMPIYEPGLEEMVRRNAQAGRLRFTCQYDDGVPDAERRLAHGGSPGRWTGKFYTPPVAANSRRRPRGPAPRISLVAPG